MRKGLSFSRLILDGLSQYINVPCGPLTCSRLWTRITESLSQSQWSLADIETSEWLITSVSRREGRVSGTGFPSPRWSPRTLWSSCSCSSSGATPSSSPTGPGTGSSTQTGTREQTCGGDFDKYLVLILLIFLSCFVGFWWMLSSQKRRIQMMNQRQPVLRSI